MSHQQERFRGLLAWLLVLLLSTVFYVYVKLVAPIPLNVFNSVNETLAAVLATAIFFLAQRNSSRVALFLFGLVAFVFVWPHWTSQGLSSFFERLRAEPANMGLYIYTLVIHFLATVIVMAICWLSGRVDQAGNVKAGQARQLQFSLRTLIFTTGTACVGFAATMWIRENSKFHSTFAVFSSDALRLSVVAVLGLIAVQEFKYRFVRLVAVSILNILLCLAVCHAFRLDCYVNWVWYAVIQVPLLIALLFILGFSSPSSLPLPKTNPEN